jgi:hypothetical protein
VEVLGLTQSESKSKRVKKECASSTLECVELDRSLSSNETRGKRDLALKQYSPKHLVSYSELAQKQALNGKMVPGKGFQHQFTSGEICLCMLGESSNLSRATIRML